MGQQRGGEGRDGALPFVLFSLRLSHCVAHTGLKLEILLLQLPKCWD